MGKTVKGERADRLLHPPLIHSLAVAAFLGERNAVKGKDLTKKVPIRYRPLWAGVFLGERSRSAERTEEETESDAPPPPPLSGAAAKWILRGVTTRDSLCVVVVGCCAARSGNRQVYAGGFSVCCSCFLLKTGVGAGGGNTTAR